MDSVSLQCCVEVTWGFGWDVKSGKVGREIPDLVCVIAESILGDRSTSQRGDYLKLIL